MLAYVSAALLLYLQSGYITCSTGPTLSRCRGLSRQAAEGKILRVMTPWLWLCWASQAQLAAAASVTSCSAATCKDTDRYVYNMALWPHFDMFCGTVMHSCSCVSPSIMPCCHLHPLNLSALHVLSNSTCIYAHRQCCPCFVPKQLSQQGLLQRPAPCHALCCLYW